MFITILLFIIGSAISLLSPEIRNFVWNNLLISILVVVLFFSALYYFFKRWKNNNYLNIEKKQKYSLIIKGENDNILSIPLPNILLTPEDITSFELCLKFPKGVREKLNSEKFFTLIFDKPPSLNLIYKPTKGKKLPEIVKNGADDTIYCGIFHYGRNIKKLTLLFELDSDPEEETEFKLYFEYGDKREKIDKIIDKKKPILESDILYDAPAITPHNCVMIKYK